MEPEKKSWLQSLFAYAEGEKKKMLLSVALSVISVSSGLAPFYCMYRLICLFAAGTAQTAVVIRWCLWALLAYGVKIITFTLSTGVSHNMAYHVLEGLRLRLADRFLHAPLGDAENHTIGEIKSMMVDKIENLEPPLAHMIPEGAGHVVLPIVSIIALLCIDWRLVLASLVTFPLSFFCMGLTFKISGKNFQTYDTANAYMNSTIVEYIEGIEVIKAFGRAGVSYEKYARAITDFRTFVVKWLSSTYLTMKLSFALFPSTLIGTLPVALALANNGVITAPMAVLAVIHIWRRSFDVQPPALSPEDDRSPARQALYADVDAAMLPLTEKPSFHLCSFLSFEKRLVFSRKLGAFQQPGLASKLARLTR